MRRTLLSLSLLLIGSIGYSQVDIPDVDISKRKEYVMKNYNVDSQKADRYEEILHSLQQEKDQLRNTKISSAQFKAGQRKIYKKYGALINQAFYGDQEALLNNPLLQVRRVSSMPNGLDERISISIYPPSTTGEILFNDCWRNDTFKTWFNTGSSGSSLMTVLLFMNEQDFIIHRKLIRIIYRKNR